MTRHAKLSVLLSGALGLSLVSVDTASEREAPAELTGTTGQPARSANNDGFIRFVTANDGTFNVDVRPNTKTVTVSEAGALPYSCTYQPGQQNPASINLS